MHVARYLKGSPGRGLFLPRSSELQVFSFSDADWASCVDSRRSVSGYCFFIGHSLISWRLKKQTTVSRSSVEAEYCALAAATCELQWIAFLLRDLHISCHRQSVLYCDNQSALHIAANPVFHERIKHLDIDCHIIREKVAAGLMRLLLVSTLSQRADILTKGLPFKSFVSFLPKLRLIDIFQPHTCRRYQSMVQLGKRMIN